VSSQIVEFVDPYSGHSVIMVSGLGLEVFGISYDPRSTSAPTPWSGACHHCMAGRDRSLSIHLKREIRFVGSYRPTGQFDVPTNGAPTSMMKVDDPVQGTTIHIVDAAGDHIIAKTDKDNRISWSYPASTVGQSWGLARQVRRPQQVLGRCFKMLAESRPMERHVFLKLISPLVVEQKNRSSKQISRWSPCRLIDWTSIASQLIGEKP
jgi:hypothetical protein